MRISTGISEINLAAIQKNRNESVKAYIWPVYNAGRVERIHGITRRTESNAVYSKPNPEDKEKIYRLALETTHNEYTSRGSQELKASVQPGSLFDAIV